MVCGLQDKIWRRIRHYPFLLYWILYDYFLTFWVRLKKIDYIGVYVRIMSNSEREILFEKNSAGYGYNGYTIIKIGFETGRCTINAVADLINHETLHQILYNRINSDADKKLDNIHKWQRGSIDFVN